MRRRRKSASERDTNCPREWEGRVRNESFDGEREGDTSGARGLATFTALVALLAILADAAVGHALLWENDPYWTYWITKTFLIATVFGLGTAWLGTGVVRGAAVAFVHTIVLTVYYWTLSPIGLPSHPDWLDLEHTWITGVPVHFSVIYLGYLVALWLWRRRPLADAPAGRDALAALGAGVVIVVVAGGFASLAVGDFPGVTWFVVRLLVTVPFLIFWWAAAGRDWPAAVGGAITLAFIWGAYGHFLGPSGLPDSPLRIIGEAPPPANVEWLGYRDLWLISVPIYLLVSGAVLIAAVPRLARARLAALPAAGTLALVAAPLLIAIPFADTSGDNAALDASGAAQVERGEWYSGDFEEADAQLTLQATDQGGRVTPLPPHDRVTLEARVEHPDGETYEIRADRSLVDDPLGRHGTWWGVGLDVWHHGDSGIGTNRLPAIHSEVAVFAVGEVRRNGELVAAGVPVHVMTADHGLPGRFELNVGDEHTPVAGLPDERLRVVWDDYSGGGEKKTDRHLFGTIVLVLLLGLALVANTRAVPVPRERRIR
ncbi:MAG: hypothetical protein ICV59_09720 [Thermoleophilia bacterium]|nr:hypothetical protein [Thermoleophilia bacterium]